MITRNLINELLGAFKKLEYYVTDWNFDYDSCLLGDG